MMKKVALLMVFIAFAAVDTFSQTVTVTEKNKSTTTMYGDYALQYLDSIDFDYDSKKSKYSPAFDITIENGDTIISVQPSSIWDVFNVIPYRAFNGHLASFQMGVNSFANPNYDMYPSLPNGNTDEFMDLKQAASWEVNLNVFEWNFPFTRRQNFGMVAGLGFSWNNYKFTDRVTIDLDDDGNILPEEVEGDDYRKSKLMVSYLTLPITFEYQFGGNGNANQRMFVSAGVVGALNLGSHTKIKADSNKTKDRGDFAVEPFKYSGIVQFGSNDVWLYATYSFSKLFKKDRGPELTPFSIGISLCNF